MTKPDRDGTLPWGGGGVSDSEPAAWFCPDCGGTVTWSSALLRLSVATRDLHAAQERIRALEIRLEECRGVVRAAVRLRVARVTSESPDIANLSNVIHEVFESGRAFDSAVDALSPTTREWAEGSPEEGE